MLARDEVCGGDDGERGECDEEAEEVEAQPCEEAEGPEGSGACDRGECSREGVSERGELVFFEESDERACGADPVDFEVVDGEGAACAPAVRADGEAEIDVVRYFESEELVRVDGVVCGA